MAAAHWTVISYSMIHTASEAAWLGDAIEGCILCATSPEIGAAVAVVVTGVISIAVLVVVAGWGGRVLGVRGGTGGATSARGVTDPSSAIGGVVSAVLLIDVADILVDVLSVAGMASDGGFVAALEPDVADEVEMVGKQPTIVPRSDTLISSASSDSSDSLGSL